MSLHRILLIAIIIMVTIGAGLTIAVIWAPSLLGELYVKLIVTLGILIVLAGLVLVLKADLAENKKLKDENYLD